MIKSNYPNHPNDFIQKELNLHDKNLIEKAKQLHCAEWIDVNEKDAETIEGYKELHHIASKLYHKEEAMINNL